jgi:hypothetical protein
VEDPILNFSSKSREVKQAAEIAPSNFPIDSASQYEKRPAFETHRTSTLGDLPGRRRSPSTLERMSVSRSHIQQQCPNATIHAFEPGREGFARLEAAHDKRLHVKLNHFALGSKAGQLELIENSYSVLRSFLELGRDALVDQLDRRPEGRYPRLRSRGPQRRDQQFASQALEFTTKDWPCPTSRRSGYLSLPTGAGGFRFFSSNRSTASPDKLGRDASYEERCPSPRRDRTACRRSKFHRKSR